MPIYRPDQSVANLRTEQEATAEVSILTPIADTGAYEVTDITCVADSAGSLSGKYFKLYDESGSVAFWIDVDNGGTTIPAGASACTRAVEITTIATGDSAATVATKVAAAVDADAKFSASVSNSTHVVVTSSTIGTKTDAADGAQATGFTISVTTQGVASNLQNKYFVINSASNAASYYVWCNVGAEGVDPAVAGKTGVEVTLSAGASASAVATAIASAVDAQSAFAAEVDGSNVVITNAATGVATDGTAGNSPFTFARHLHGHAALYTAGGSPADLTNTPSTIGALS